MIAALLATGACNKPAPEGSAEGAPSRKTAQADGKTQAFSKHSPPRSWPATSRPPTARSPEGRATLTQHEFEESFRHYRDRLPDSLKTTVQVDFYDKEAAVFVPDHLRDRIAFEATIHYEPGGDLEGFASTVWMILESPASRSWPPSTSRTEPVFCYLPVVASCAKAACAALATA